MASDQFDEQARARGAVAHAETRFAWTLHNLVGHPLSEIAWQLGWERLSDWLHDVTLPANAAVKEGADDNR